MFQSFYAFVKKIVGNIDSKSIIYYFTLSKARKANFMIILFS